MRKGRDTTPGLVLLTAAQDLDRIAILIAVIENGVFAISLVITCRVILATFNVKDFDNFPIGNDVNILIPSLCKSSSNHRSKLLFLAHEFFPWAIFVIPL